jgi:hypothetical protein
MNYLEFIRAKACVISDVVLLFDEIKVPLIEQQLIPFIFANAMIFTDVTNPYNLLAMDD